MKLQRSGFTVVEMVIVAAIIAIVAAIAIPNYVRARQESHKSSCIANLRQIANALEQARMNDTATPQYPADIVGADKYLKIEPLCPTSKTGYSLDAGYTPHCPNEATLPQHILPEFTPAGAPAAETITP